MSDQPNVPASRPPTAERRDITIEALSSLFAVGRLELEEFEARVDRAIRAETVADLDQLVADLAPTGEHRTAPVPAPPREPMGQDLPRGSRATIAVWSGTSYAVGHLPYTGNVDESFGIAAKDPAGNALVRGSYPNPFSFRTSDDSTPTTQVDNVFALTSPLVFETLSAGQPNVIAWYSNQTGVAMVRLSYSTDAGQTYTKIADVPYGDGVHVWYPPKLTSSFQLRAEGMNVNGTTVASANIFPVNVTGDDSPLQVLSGPDVSLPSASSALVTVRLDRAPASAFLACEGLSPVPATLSGDRPEVAFVSTTNGVDGVAEKATTRSACRAFAVNSGGRKPAASEPDENTAT